MAREQSFIVQRIWEELSQINMQKVNRACQQNVQILLAGSTDTIESMKQWLASFPCSTGELPIPTNAIFSNPKEMEKRIILLQLASGEADINEKLIKTADFCIVEPVLADTVKTYHAEVYPFDMNDTKLAAQILANNFKLRFALSHTFPAFRAEHARIEIQETAIQNAAWVLISALPSFLSPPQRTIVAPIEAITDFFVLTINEIKLMFELIGLLGEKIRFKHIFEFVFVLSLARGARNLATFIVSKIPARMGIVAKGALAYAFTWAIGEAVVFFIVSRERMSWKLFMDRTKHHFQEGKQISRCMIEKRERMDK